MANVSIIGGTLGLSDSNLGFDFPILPTGLPIPDTIINLGLNDPVPLIHVGTNALGFVAVAIDPSAPLIQIRAGTPTEELLNTVIGASGGNFALTLPDLTSPTQYLHVGAAGAGYLGVAYNQDLGLLQIRGGLDDGDPSNDFSYVIPFPPSGAGLPGLPSAAAADSFSTGTGTDTVVGLGNATAAGLGGVVSALGVDSIVSAVTDALTSALPGGSDAFAASSASSFAGADSLAAASLVSDFVSGSLADAPVVTLVDTLGDLTSGALVSLDQGLTTLDLSGLTSKLPFGNN